MRVDGGLSEHPGRIDVLVRGQHKRIVVVRCGLVGQVEGLQRERVRRIGNADAIGLACIVEVAPCRIAGHIDDATDHELRLGFKLVAHRLRDGRDVSCTRTL